MLEEEARCLIAVYQICLRSLFTGDVFDLITPKTVLDDIKLHSSGSDSNKWKYVVPDISQVKFPWIKYIDANVKHSIGTCLISRKWNKILIDVWRCLMNCSPSCQIMKQHEIHSCIPLKMGMANNLMTMLPLIMNTVIFQRHLLSPVSCPFIYSNHVFVVYQKLLTFSLIEFRTEATLRINVTFPHFDLSQKIDCFEIKRRCRQKHLAFVLFMNRVYRKKPKDISAETNFEVRMFIQSAEADCHCGLAHGTCGRRMCH